MHSTEGKTVCDGNNILDMSLISVIGDRNNQQDRFGYLLSEAEGIVILCDGMGGLNYGEIASRTAVECFLSEYRFGMDTQSLVQQLKKITIMANERIESLSDGEGNPLMAGSTLAVAVIQDDRLFWNSVGDSRMYLLRDNEFVQLTLDQNYRTVLIEKKNAGLISDEEFKRENQSGEALISYLGMDVEPLIDYNDIPITLKKNDLLIVMTDGLYKILSDNEIKTIMKKSGDINETICSLELSAQQYAKQKKISRDNMTVAVIKIK